MLTPLGNLLEDVGTLIQLGNQLHWLPEYSPFFFFFEREREMPSF